MIKLTEITDSSFYFYHGYIIRIHNDSLYANLYQLHTGVGLGSIKDRSKQLQYCMNRVDELKQEQADEEACQKELDSFIKDVQPYIEAIQKEIAKRNNNND